MWAKVDGLTFELKSPTRLATLSSSFQNSLEGKYLPFVRPQDIPGRGQILPTPEPGKRDDYDPDPVKMIKIFMYELFPVYTATDDLDGDVGCVDGADDYIHGGNDCDDDIDDDADDDDDQVWLELRSKRQDNLVPGCQVVCVCHSNLVIVSSS